MSSGRSQGRRRRGKKPKAVDLWRPVAPLDPPEPIRPASDATAVVRSLGSPPLKGQGVKAEQNLYLVADAAAKAAMGLAHLAELVEAHDPGEPDDVDGP